jgi:hypothetical protein
LDIGEGQDSYSSTGKGRGEWWSAEFESGSKYVYLVTIVNRQGREEDGKWLANSKIEIDG